VISVFAGRCANQRTVEGHGKSGVAGANLNRCRQNGCCAATDQVRALPASDAAIVAESLGQARFRNCSHAALAASAQQVIYEFNERGFLKNPRAPLSR